MLSFTIEFEKNIPKYKTLYNYIIEHIINGSFKSNEKMPSKRKLSSDLGVSQNTIIEVYELLKSEGYLYSIEKKGYYVSPVEIKTIKRENIIYQDFKKILPTYNLTTSMIDSSLFPSITWARLTKEVLKEDYFLLGDNKGDLSLRNEISKYIFESRGIIANPNNIIIGSGIENLLPLILPLLNPPFGIEDPGYKKVKEVIDNAHLETRYINLKYDNINQCNTIYVTPTHQFPTGKTISITKRVELTKWAQDDKYIIEDDYDGEYRFDGFQAKPLFSLSNDNVIYLSTFSRTIAPSVRIAYMILPNKLIEKYQIRYHSYANPVPRINQQVLASFLQTGAYSRHIRKSKVLYKKKRDLIISLLKKNNISFEAFNIGLSITIFLNKEINEKALKEKLLEDNILISFESDYLFNKKQTSKIILGFASISIDDIPIVIPKLINEIKKSW